LCFWKMSKNHEKSCEKVKNNAKEQAFGTWARHVLAVNMAQTQCLSGFERFQEMGKVECP
jgi:hypothetical protein